MDIKKFFTDKDGKWAVVQPPNALLWAWIVLTSVSLLFPMNEFVDKVNLLKDAVLFTWAYMELTSGVSCFRRALGAGILIIVLVGITVR